MKLERTKNSIRIMKAEIINKFVYVFGPFIVRTVFIHTLGAEYLGVNGLFTSILTVLNLTELGFGSAIVFNMYQAIANDDDVTINALLNFYRKVYACIGVIILMIGLVILPFLPRLITGECPTDINLYIVYIVFLINSVLSYFMFAYLTSLLNAFQRSDIVTKVNVIFTFVMYVLQITILLTTENYYIYISITPIFTIITNLWTAFLAEKYYPQYKPAGKITKKLKKDIKEKVGGLLVDKLCGVSRNAFDSIFISMFVGLTQIGIYNNYYYIMNAVTGIVAITINSMAAGVGNSIASETKEKNYGDMIKVNFIYMWMSGWCTVCLVCLYQNFMKLWAGNDLLLSNFTVVLICIYFYILKMGDVKYIYVQGSGIWWESRFRALIEAVANIMLNYFLGKIWGISGIVLATIISLFFINFCYGSHLIFKYYFTEQNALDYYSNHLFYAFVTMIVTSVTFLLCSLCGNSMLALVVKMCICVVIPNMLYFIVYRRTKIFSLTMPWALSRLHIKEDGYIWKLIIK